MEKRSFSGDDGARVSSSKFAEAFHKTAALVSYRTRCGKANCRCTRGNLHGPYWFLRWRDGDTQRRRYVRAEDLDAVRAVIEARRALDREARAAAASARFDLRELRRWLKEIDRFLAN